MKELSDREWQKFSQQAVQKFSQALGADNVKADEHGIRLVFELGTKGGMDQFNRFGGLASDNGVQFVATAFSGASSATGPRLLSEAVISRHQKSILSLIVLAEQMSAAVLQDGPGEKRRVIAPTEPEHVLEKVTGVPWEFVTDSVYAGKVVEARVKPADRKIRARQEHGVGYVLHPDGYGKGDVRQWLEHQERVEAETGTEPRTVLPEDWVSRTCLDNAKTVDDSVRGELPKLFRK